MPGELVQNEAVLLSQKNRVLESMAKGVPLPLILQAVSEIVAQQEPTLSAAIVYEDDGGARMRAGTPASAGLSSIWSSSILAGETSLGSLEVYGHDAPSPAHVELFEQVLHLAKIALERVRDQGFRGTFDNAAIGITHNDPKGRFLRANRRACELLGYSQAEMLQKTLQQVTYPEDVFESVDKLGMMLRGEIDHMIVEKRYVRKDGNLIWVRVTAALQFDAEHKPVHTIAIIEDISARKTLEDDLRKARDVAEAANRAKDDFLANVSHEIRTPMNAILGMSEIVLDTPLDDTQRQCLSVVMSAASHLLGTINDLLDFSKIEAGKLELDSSDFSLRTAVGETLRALASRAHRKGVELVGDVAFDVPDRVRGDVGRLRQVLMNLVGNAIKFTDAGEVVVFVAREGMRLRFDVRDTGVGIPDHKQQAIFRAFEQEDTSTTRKYGGTGLGLTIAAQLVTLMGGEIAVESVPQQGSVFSFTARFELLDDALPAVAPSALRGRRVLIVDDNVASRSTIAAWLLAWGLAPITADNALAAMDALWHGVASGSPFALALVDVRMAEIDGVSLAGKIRERAELAATRILLLRSEDRPRDLDRLRHLRIDAHLSKPIPQDELLATIRDVLQRGPDDDTTLAATRTASTPRPPVVGARSLRILVAEDNEFNAQLLVLLLTRRGHSVEVVPDGRAAVTLVEQTRARAPFDLLFLDLHMPQLDGFDVIRKIREQEALSVGRRLPVVALTARSREIDRKRCFEAGMDAFLTKPLAASELWRVVERMEEG